MKSKAKAEPVQGEVVVVGKDLSGLYSDIEFVRRGVWVGTDADSIAYKGLEPMCLNDLAGVLYCFVAVAGRIHLCNAVLEARIAELREEVDRAAETEARLRIRAMYEALRAEFEPKA